ncbi:MAG: transporter [Muribaculaceae bacterium]|nr:transporter [Muribaculaceae bacterium]
MKQIIAFIKSWTLPIAMLTGAGFYYLFSSVDAITFTKPYIKEITRWLMPSLIFIQLLLSFSKIDPKDLIPKKWHVWLCFFQTASCLTIAFILMFANLNEEVKIILEGAMVCFICPTATAAAVITGKLGGSTGALLTYTMLSNVVAAIVVPLLFPLINYIEGVTFITEFSNILSRVFPLLIIPFIFALIFRYYAKPIHALLVKFSGMAYYIWAIALSIVTAQTIYHISMSNASAYSKLGVACAGLATCIIQFALGKYIGGKYDNRISAGQALGQKNTILAIWLSSTYLIPLSSLAAGSYVLWQNIFNSWQLYRKSKRDNQLQP